MKLNQPEIEKTLDDLSLGEIRYFDRLASTNDEASAWAERGAPDLSLVIADEQTAGRGRSGRSWYTPPGAALALSVVLRSAQEISPNLSHLSALGALAVKDALNHLYSLSAQIKWPNDVLLERRKVAGILVEAGWNGDSISALILGIGINVAPASVPHHRDLGFPATCVEAVLGKQVDRLELLHAVLSWLLVWRKPLRSPDFIQAWESGLAFLGEQVQIWQYEGASHKEGRDSDGAVVEGQVIGLNEDGSLRLQTPAGSEIAVKAGEVHLRPSNHPSP